VTGPAELPGPERPGPGPSLGPVVVGIDGSAGSHAAVAFALEEAALRDLAVQAVAVFDPPDLWVAPDAETFKVDHLRSLLYDRTTGIVETALADRARRGLAVPAVEIAAVRGPVSAVLERYSRDASILVVGHRGLSETTTRLIGSTGLSCVVHAHCTVVVVRA
jgi:nucleotide-binding universal stress UspA family protein